MSRANRNVFRCVCGHSLDVHGPDDGPYACRVETCACRTFTRASGFTAGAPGYGRDAVSAALERVDRLWRCTRCGYLAYSAPYGSVMFFGEEIGGYTDDCPQCGSVSEPWQWCGGLGREERERIARAACGAPLGGSGENNG